jgi:2-desacetyl-2-hydroxyethyl bacteriochlorophyllide A dehydrogenase
MIAWPQGQMTAVAIEAPGRVGLGSRPIPPEAPGNVLVETSFVGLCGTDLELLHGTASYLREGMTRYPLVFGHEWSGRVAAVGPGVSNVAPGDRVVGQTMVPCGLCPMCRRGRRSLCGRLLEVGLYGLPGAAARYIRMPASSLTALPEEISDLHGTFVEPAVTVVGAFDRISCRLDDRVAVVGTGTIGLLAVQLATRMAGTVDAIGIDDAGLPLAQQLGARQVLRPEAAHASAYSVVIEASGSAAAFIRCLELLEPGGRAAIVGVANEPINTLIPGSLTLRGIEIYGIRHGLDYYDQTIDLFATGVLDPGPLVDAVIPAREASYAFDRLEHGRRGRPKVVLQLGDAVGSDQ